MWIQRSVIIATALVAAASALFGVREIQRFDLTEGVQSSSAVEWPATPDDPVRPGKPSLVLFVHPLCSCTRATLAELARILPESGTRPEVRVYFESASTQATQLWDDAARLPNARVAWDTTGAAARRFGARTSGFIEYYDGAGRLQFQGGITAARGHEGRSAGGEALLAGIRGGHVPLKRFPVFGCALAGDRA